MNLPSDTLLHGDCLALQQGVRQPNTLVAAMARPCIDILEQVPVDGLQMRGAETAVRAVAKLHLKKPETDIGCFAFFEVIMARCTERVLYCGAVG